MSSIFSLMSIFGSNVLWFTLESPSGDESHLRESPVRLIYLSLAVTFLTFGQYVQHLEIDIHGNADPGSSAGQVREKVKANDAWAIPATKIRTHSEVRELLTVLIFLDGEQANTSTFAASIDSDADSQKRSGGAAMALVASIPASFYSIISRSANSDSSETRDGSKADAKAIASVWDRSSATGPTWDNP